MFQNQNQRIETRIQTSAHLAQTMTMLGMSSEEIREKIEGELARNPFLELVEERVCPTCKRKLPENGKCPICSQPQLENSKDNIIFISPRDDFNVVNYGSAVEPYHDEPDYDSAQTEDLATYVLKQIGPDLDEEQKHVAAYLLNSLDEDGFITTDVFEVAQYYHVLPSTVEEVVDLIQHADPLGVGSRDLKEALLVQLKHISESINVPSGTEEIILHSFDDLKHGKYREIAKRHKLTVRKVQTIEKFIGDNLNPFPARAHWGDTLAGKSNQDFTSIYHEPDILINYLNENPENQLVVEIVMPISGYLRVNQYYRKELRNAPEDRMEEWKNDLDKANLLVKSLYQRNNTISDLMTLLIEKQEAYIRNGEEFVQPLTRAQIASEMGVHESTISRAVSNKTVMLPNRKVVSLSSFFDRSLNVRTVLKELIQNETKPLSDAKLVSLLSERGYTVARRTVAKYRLMEGIGSAHQRGISAVQ
ncbi:MAG: hypothetical protein IJI14_03495 [Anaerolineaceae bacterium]|nr:hypothetical protein [Anaerolineaceae bacterium]